MYVTRAEQEAIESAEKEVALAKRLLKLLDEAGPVSLFFVPDEESAWDEFDAWDAWHFWLSKQLTTDEYALYNERYRFECDNVSELRSLMYSESNRIPGPGNCDGY